MKKLRMYCLSLYNEDYSKIKSLNYLPVGVGKEKFEDGWIRDNTGSHISQKNRYYGEYTFHYWFWKNEINKIDNNTWIGFCAYRRFWSNKIDNYKIGQKSDFLNGAKEDWENNDVILGNNIHMNGWTTMKIIKHGLKSFLVSPKYFIKKNRNLKLHFDSFHGYGNLDKAINLLDEGEKKDFADFMTSRNYFNRGNMFICGSKKIIENYYQSVFPWLERCENIFGFNHDNYGSTRIYGFLAERYMSYWFNKYSKVKEWPIIFFDINKNNI
tara:strand:+ start:261 stop:1067 length:807 start_codon:yes stop_codon:yes gene_type:complete